MEDILRVMSKFVAMLRGIGPGNLNMTAQKFRTFFEKLSFTDVQVVLSSGNIIFDSPSDISEALAELIEKALPNKLGFSRSAIVRSQSELQKLIDQDPFQGIEQNHNKGSYLLVTFFRRPTAIPFSFPFSQTANHTPY